MLPKFPNPQQYDLSKKEHLHQFVDYFYFAFMNYYLQIAISVNETQESLELYTAAQTHFRVELALFEAAIIAAVEKYEYSFDLQENNVKVLFYILTCLGAVEAFEKVLRRSNFEIDYINFARIDLLEDFFEEYCTFHDVKVPNRHLQLSYQFTFHTVFEGRERLKAILFYYIPFLLIDTSVDLHYQEKLLEGTKSEDGLRLLKLMSEERQLYKRYHKEEKNKEEKNSGLEKAFIEEVIYPFYTEESISDKAKIMRAIKARPSSAHKKDLARLLSKPKNGSEFKIEEIIEGAEDHSDAILEEYADFCVRNKPENFAKFALYTRAKDFDKRLAALLKVVDLSTFFSNRALVQSLINVFLMFRCTKSLEVIAGHPDFLDKFLPLLYSVIEKYDLKILKDIYANRVHKYNAGKEHIDAEQLFLEAYLFKMAPLRHAFLETLYTLTRAILFTCNFQEFTNIIVILLLTTAHDSFDYLLKCMKDYLSMPQHLSYIQEFKRILLQVYSAGNHNFPPQNLVKLLTCIDEIHSPKNSAAMTVIKMDPKQKPLKEHKENHETYVKLKKMLGNDSSLLIELAAVLDALKVTFGENKIVIKLAMIRSMFRFVIDASAKKECVLEEKDINNIFQAPILQKRKDQSGIKIALGTFLKTLLKPVDNVLNYEVAKAAELPLQAPAPAPARNAAPEIVEKKKESPELKKWWKKKDLSSVITILYGLSLNENHYHNGSLVLCYAVLGRLWRLAYIMEDWALTRCVRQLVIPAAEKEQKEFARDIGAMSVDYFRHGNKNTFFTSLSKYPCAVNQAQFNVQATQYSLADRYPKAIVRDVVRYQQSVMRNSVR